MQNPPTSNWLDVFGGQRFYSQGLSVGRHELDLVGATLFVDSYHGTNVSCDEPMLLQVDA